MPSIYTFSPATVLSRTLLWSGSGGGDWVARPDLLELSSGVWVCIYTVAPQHVAIDGNTFIYIRFSANQGETWTAANTYLNGSSVTGFPLARHGLNTMTDAWLALAPNGDLLVHATEDRSPDPATTYQYRSTNGGATWSAEGEAIGTEIWADHDGGVIIGGDIYITGRTETVSEIAGANNLYKSDDNGATWDFVSTITDVDVDQMTGEVALIWHGGENFTAIMRGTDNNGDYSYMRRSDDLGLTWGELENFTTIMGGLKIHRPRHVRMGSRIYVMGRDWIGDAGTFLDNNIFFWSDDETETWSAVQTLNPSIVVDSGYVDMIQRGDGTLYFLAYEGDYDACSIYQYVVEVNA